ncbi:conjugal transfer inhibition FipA domain protein [Brevibacillus laterosporus GI-9]|uniref:DUF6710 family protein n=1 Tax=Brevibacillus laterosporus TaxID=1465 RepID=UPI0002405400|nr:DUF6710 family protein [Brevibacillus laterosporus]CCF16470.1 conjugal transfer inhibition FipA domain protein [Brevibacillus laterosporus GI-9]
MFKWFQKNKREESHANALRDHDIQKKQFDRMLSIANDIFRKAEQHEVKDGYKHPILNYVKLLGMNLQTAYITNLLYEDDHGEIKKYPSITPWFPFFELSAKVSLDGKSMYDMIFHEVDNKCFEIDLNRDLVLPWPWNISRYVNSISSIGKSRPWGKWKEDTLNHYVQVLLPMGICFVEGGNHSITSGIINGEGKLIAKNVYDFSEIYNYVYTNGIQYRRLEDDSVISNVTNLEFAVIFEVGRMMLKHGVSR